MADRRSVFVVEFVLLLFLLFQYTFGQQLLLLPSDEQLALLELRSSLGLRAKDWPRKVDPCKFWIGVQCQTNGSSSSSRVVGINVSGLRRTRLGRLNPRFSVNALANLTLLETFNASGFSLPGLIPDWFGLLLPSLQVLDLRSCSVSGPIPSTLGNLNNLTVLNLSDNNLTSSIPSTLSQLSSLSVLDLSKNFITGFIPLSFSSLGNLTSLDLSYNFLSGSIPPELGILSNLQILNLSNNSFSSSIPVQLGDLSRLVDLDLGFNILSGSLPPDLKGLRSLRRMVVGSNSLVGSLPDNLFSNLVQLQFLVLSHNNLSGHLPDFLWLMPRLQFLDVAYNNFSGILPNLSSVGNATAATFNLAHNQFYGALPSQLRRFNFIDLSDNYFKGKVSEDTPRSASLTTNCLQSVPNQRSLENCTLFYASRGLTFDNFGIPNATDIPAPGVRRKRSNRWKFILAGVLGGVGVIIVLAMLLVLCLRKRDRGDADESGRGVGPAPAPTGASPPPAGVTVDFSKLGEGFTYAQLLQATSDFSDVNLIKNGHSGDLFRGVIESGIPVVIKRIDVRSSNKESYMAELDLFSRTAHTRLITLLGHCLEHDNEKLLVYKYMPNGDLSNSLYRKTNQEEDGLQSLDWITRLKIAIGVAEGLSYLHHECSPPLVHRDLQASSVLLDDKFEVRLGSLSEVCIQEGDTHQNVISRFLRLPQTSEQGPSGASSSTCAYDVYCFGKVLLELVTGKLGISASNDSTTNEWLEQTLPYISIYERELMTKIVDPSLIVDEDLLEEVWAMAIVARSCLNPKPSKRPLMRYILKALENPLKVVREESSGSARLRTASSRGSWNAALFGSWRHSSSDIVTIPGSTNTREGGSTLKRSFTAGSQGSTPCGGGGDHSCSNKKLSRDIFPEPADMPVVDRPGED